MNFGKITSVCVIGGGEPMIHFAQYCKAHNIDVTAIMAPRHLQAELPRSNQITKDVLEQSHITYQSCDDINDVDFIEQHIRQKQFSIIVCFGPAWVFNDDLLRACNHNIVNFNGIPIPRYLGGAHYTWQILNQDRTSGMIIQHITSKLDKGDILKMEYSDLPDTVHIPQDYFEENFHIACRFLESFADELLAQVDFSETPFHTLMAKRQYFPRLLTLHQAYIDWSWDGQDIVLFCAAFDTPYAGASSFVAGLEDGKKRVFMKGVTLITDEITPHPFCSGLVIRKFEDALYIAVRGGLLKVPSVYDEQGHDMISSIREGYRFFVDQGDS